MSEEPKPLADLLDGSVGRIVRAHQHGVAVDREQQERLDKRQRQWGIFSNAVGRRYAGCRFSNFEAPTAEAKAVVEALKEYARDPDERLARGEGILLYGRQGTGKDHLLTALAREVIGHFHSLAWKNGADLWGDVRDAIGNSENERTLVDSLVRPAVLYLSDPLPPVGKLTEFQASTLFRILDGRYRQLRPTWCSVNATDRQNLEDCIGGQNADRLRDGALALFCNWPSHRKPAGSNTRGVNIPHELDR